MTYLSILCVDVLLMCVFEIRMRDHPYILNTSPGGLLRNDDITLKAYRIKLITKAGEGVQNPHNGGDDMCGWSLSKFDFVGDIVLLYHYYICFNL